MQLAVSPRIMSAAVSAPPLSAEEQEQLQQTIEMFEVIVQASPQDTQSLEILKDAYLRLGKTSEGSGVARRLADTYRELGQFSQSLLEYETLLQREPNNMEVMAAIGEVEEQLQKSGQAKGGAKSLSALADNIQLDFGSVQPLSPSPSEGGNLVTTSQTHRAGSNGSARALAADDGNETLAKFLVQHRLVSDDVVAAAFERVSKKNKARNPNMLAASLIDEISRRGNIELETLLSGILDRSKFAYIPLEYYEVDRSVVKMLPEDITLARLIIPFDVMSRTLMVAMANPFDAAGKETVQQLLDYNIQWHLASPQAINKVLTETYRITTAASESGMRLA